MALNQLAKGQPEEEIQKLNIFLMKNYQGQLGGMKTPVDTVIEILREEKQK